MKIGYFLFPEARFPESDETILDEALEEARLAEALGADAVFLAEHHFDGNCVYVDPPTFAGALAMATKRIKIGFAVLQTSLYQPVRLAEQLSLLDHLSKGRLIIGLGKGSAVNTHEYIGFHIDPDEAQARFEEVEEILVKTWTGEHVVHNGRFWNFEIPMLRPRPFTKPHPQILRATNSDRTIAGQARLGRPVLLAPKVNSVTHQAVATFSTAMRSAGFADAEVASALDQSWVWRHLIVADTDREALDDLHFFREMQEYRAKQSKKFMDNVLVTPTFPDAIPPGMLCGSPDTVLAQLGDLPATGLGGLILTSRLGPMPSDVARRSFRLFMDKVAPALAQASRDRPAEAARA